MILSLTIVFHVALGTIALLSGALALGSAKGSKLHRYSGKTFVLSMTISSLIGAYVAFLKPELITLVSGLLTSYLSLTAWASVSLKNRNNVVYCVSMLAALTIGMMALSGGLDAVNSKDSVKDGFPAAPYFVFGGLAIFAGLLDLKCLVRVSHSRAQILVRHIWRMCTAMLIGASAIFLGQMQIFPIEIRSESILSIPLLIILIVALYYLIWVRLSFRQKGN